MTSREGFSFLPPPSCSSPCCPPCPSRLLLCTPLHSSPSLPLCIINLCFFCPSHVSRLPRFAYSFVLPLHTGSCSFSPFSAHHRYTIISLISSTRSLPTPLVTFQVSVGFPSLPSLRSSLLPSVFSCFLGFSCWILWGLNVHYLPHYTFATSSLLYHWIASPRLRLPLWAATGPSLRAIPSRTS